MVRADKKLLKDIFFLILLMLLSIFIYSNKGRANELRLLEADKVSMDTYKVWHNYDPYFNNMYEPDQEEHFSWGVTMHADLVFVEYSKFKWDFKNEVDGISTNQAFRSVEWRYRTQMTIYDKVGAFWQHLSRHSLDAEPEVRQPYPLVDKFGIELIFYKR